MTPADTTPHRPPDAPRVRALRRRVLERVADAEPSHRSIAGDGEGWQPFVDGIRIKILREQGEVLSYLLELQPGAVLPAHRHPLDEECVVLQGRLQVGTRHEIGPGGYHLAHAGALHARVTTDTGAVIFLRGAIPDADHALA